MFDLGVSLLRAATSIRILPDQFDAQHRLADTLKPEDESYLALVTRGTTMTHRRWLELNEARDRMRRAWRKLFKKSLDVILCPAAASTAPFHSVEMPVTRTDVVHQRLRGSRSRSAHLGLNVGSILSAFNGHSSRDLLRRSSDWRADHLGRIQRPNMSRLRSSLGRDVARARATATVDLNAPRPWRKARLATSMTERCQFWQLKTQHEGCQRSA